jgi:CheY-like chemotaxis protein
MPRRRRAPYPGPVSLAHQLHASWPATILVAHDEVSVRAILRRALEGAGYRVIEAATGDGTGYPYGLRGEEIPLAARIVAVVDSFDAMTTDRPYRAALRQEEALQRLDDGREEQWDPLVVDVFVAQYAGVDKAREVRSLAREGAEEL